MGMQSRWQEVVSAAVDQAHSLATYLHDAPHDTDAREQLARVARRIRSIAAREAVAELGGLAKRVEALAVESELNVAEAMEMAAAVERMRVVAESVSQSTGTEHAGESPLATNEPSSQINSGQYFAGPSAWPDD